MQGMDCGQYARAAIQAHGTASVKSNLGVKVSDENPIDTSSMEPKHQKINLVKPPKRLNEMTEEEMRAWARGLGEAFKNRSHEQHDEKV